MSWLIAAAAAGAGLAPAAAWLAVLRLQGRFRPRPAPLPLLLSLAAWGAWTALAHTAPHPWLGAVAPLLALVFCGLLADHWRRGPIG